MVCCMNPFSCLFGICCGLAGNATKKMSNASYFSAYLIWMIACLIIEYLPSDNSIVDSNLDKLFHSHGIEIVYRASCAIASSFVLLFLMTLAWPVVHHMFLLVFCIFLVGFGYLFIWGIKSNSYLYGFRNIARFVSALYLILQSMALVDLSFSAHDIITEKMDETNVEFASKKYSYTDKTCCCSNQWTSMYLTLSILFSIGSVAACIAFYFIFRVNGKLCFQNGLVISITLLMGIGCCLLSISSIINKGILAPAVFFAIICIYLVISLLTNPSDKCNPFLKSSNYWVTVINVLLLVVSGYWMAFRIRNTSEDNDAPADTEKGEKKTIKIPDEDSRQGCVFNACMIIASFYLAMLCSAWYNGDITKRPAAVFDFTSASTFWIYNISIWIGFFVFLYVLVAPLINKNRSY